MEEAEISSRIPHVCMQFVIIGYRALFSISCEPYLHNLQTLALGARKLASALFRVGTTHK